MAEACDQTNRKRDAADGAEDNERGAVEGMCLQYSLTVYQNKCTATRQTVTAGTLFQSLEGQRAQYVAIFDSLCQELLKLFLK